MKPLLKELNQSHAALARHLNIGKATMSRLLNEGQVPAGHNPEQLQQKITDFLIDAGATKKAAMAATAATFAPVEAEKAPTIPTTKDEDMLLRKQTLTPAAKRHFGLLRNPFDEVRKAHEVYLTADARYVRESMRHVALHGGFIAVSGESGSGKSTLRRDLINWGSQQSTPITFIQPYVLGMEDNDIKGKTLKIAAITDSILGEVAAGQHVKRSSEAKFKQMHQALLESHRAGNRHVLIIEEAHSLPLPTLKHLKRLYELEAADGFSSLISIILLGQTELAQKLDERNPSVREVVQRCELITLRALDNDLEPYLKHRFAGVNKDVTSLMPPACFDALNKKLLGNTQRSVLYPLAIHNVLTAAMNEAAELGVNQLTPELIAEV